MGILNTNTELYDKLKLTANLILNVYKEYREEDIAQTKHGKFGVRIDHKYEEVKEDSKWVINTTKYKTKTGGKIWKKRYYTIAMSGIYPGVGNEKILIVAFRGTQTGVEWMYNCDASKAWMYHDTKFGSAAITKKQKNKYMGNVHKGFYSIYNDIRKYLHLDVTNFLKKYDNQQIIICGHSLGGAIATLAALDVSKTHGVVPTLYTYGAPRVGNEEFKFNLENYVFVNRVAHAIDPVTGLPLKSKWHVHGGATRIEYPSKQKFNVKKNFKTHDLLHYQKLLLSPVYYQAFVSVPHKHAWSKKYRELGVEDIK